MTLLESLVALVILGLAAVGFLEVFQRVTATTRDTQAWTAAVATAETAMERAVIGIEGTSDSVRGPRPSVQRRSYGVGLREIIVTVPLEGSRSATVELHRLVVAP